MAGEEINMLTMMCTKICTVKTDSKDVYDLRCIRRNTVRDLFTSSIIEFI